MISSARSSSEWRLYVIVDASACAGRDPVQVAAAAIRGGADVIQLRDKAASGRAFYDRAQRLLAVTKAAGVPLIVNDRADIASAVGADGVHLGQDDIPLAAARALLGAGRLIGKSTHSLEQALAAQAEGANYLGCGPVFPTPTKPDSPSVGVSLVREVASRISLPVICIGGIDSSTLEPVLQAGGRCVAVLRAVCAAPDPESATRRLTEHLSQFLPITPSLNL